MRLFAPSVYRREKALPKQPIVYRIFSLVKSFGGHLAGTPPFSENPQKQPDFGFFEWYDFVNYL
jgi:hypothetical protein